MQSKSCRSRAVLRAAGSAWQVIPIARAIFWSRASYRTFRTPSGASIAARSSWSFRAWMCRTSRWSVWSRLRLSSSCRRASSALRPGSLVARMTSLRRVGHEPADPLLALAVAVGVGRVDVGDPQVDRPVRASRALSSSSYIRNRLPEPKPRIETSARSCRTAGSAARRPPARARAGAIACANRRGTEEVTPRDIHGALLFVEGSGIPDHPTGPHPDSHDRHPPAG